MTHLVVSLFKDPNDAREIINSLQEAGFNRSNLEFVEADPENQSFFKRVFGDGDDEEMKAEQALEYMTGLGVPEDDADDYATKIEKGQSLVMVRCESDAEIERAQAVIEPTRDRADVESKTGGEAPPHSRTEAPHGAENAPPHEEERVPPHAEERAAESGEGKQRSQLDESDTDRREMQDPAGDKEQIQATEEELHVGKRREETAGVRVTKETTEEEDQEEVSLREEDVEVERRDVDRPLKEGEQAFQEEEIEVSETREEPVIEKESRVREEVTVDKETEEHPETIHETVRKEHINVEDLAQKANPRFEQFEPQLRTHYQDNYADSEHDFDEYSRGYRYGMALAESDQNRGNDWNDIEADAGRRWDNQESTRWDDFKDAVRHGFQRIRGGDEQRRPQR